MEPRGEEQRILAAEKREQTKITQYSETEAGRNGEVHPVVFECSGRAGPKTIELFKKWVSEDLISNSELSKLLTAISTSIAYYNGKCIARVINSGTDHRE